jgi:UDP-arabinose 4-epimerase
MTALDPTNILVTGGAGFIGSHTCKALAARQLTPITFDNLSRGYSGSIRWGTLFKGDILNRTELEQAFNYCQPKCVIHFAALAYVGESVTDPLAYYQTNVAGLINVLSAMVKFGADTIVFSSSCATYGIPASLPIAESEPQRPINPYGHSKLFCERILIDAAAAHRLRFAILRYFNACGADPDGDLTEMHDPETHLIPLAIDAAAGRASPLRIFGSDYPTADGTCERDYIHVSDLAQEHIDALGYLAQYDEPLIVNLGTGRAHSIREIIAAIERVTGRTVPTVAAARRPGDPPRLVAEPRLAHIILGFRPRYSDLDTIITTAVRSRELWLQKDSTMPMAKGSFRNYRFGTGVLAG